MKLIADWKKSHRLYSQRINAVGVALSGAYIALYEQIRDVVPPQYLAILTAVIFAAGFVGRLIKQEPNDAGTETTN